MVASFITTLPAQVERQDRLFCEKVAARALRCGGPPNQIHELGQAALPSDFAANRAGLA